MSEYEKSIVPKQSNFVQGRLDFNFVCLGCGEKVNKATRIYCHECEGGHDVHTYPQAVSLLNKKSNDKMVKDQIKGTRVTNFEY